MKVVVYLVLLVALTGCASKRFSVTSDAARLERRHRFVADVTCTSAQPRLYKTFSDEFHMLAMMPRIRWTVTFQMDRTVKGNPVTNAFQLDDARDRATPFDVTDFSFQTNMTYRVGFDRITDGVVRGLEIFTNAATVRTNAALTPTFATPVRWEEGDTVAGNSAEPGSAFGR